MHTYRTRILIFMYSILQSLNLLKLLFPPKSTSGISRAFQSTPSYFTRIYTSMVVVTSPGPHPMTLSQEGGGSGGGVGGGGAVDHQRCR